MAKKALDSQEIIQFVDRLIDERGLDLAEPEIVAQVRADLVDRVEDRINAAIVEKIPPTKLDEFEKLLSDEVDELALQEFCRKHIPHLDEVLASALLDFRKTYLNI